jgi:5,10-methylenetetrahydrofolate reductase
MRPWIRGVDQVRRKQEPKEDGRSFCVAVGSDPASGDLSKPISTMKERRESGADLAITQPAFHAEDLIESFYAPASADQSLPALIGLLVPRSGTGMGMAKISDMSDASDTYVS